MDNKEIVELLQAAKEWIPVLGHHDLSVLHKRIDKAIHSLQSQEARGCTLCANGNDLPEGEYCRACGLENNISPLRRAVKLARGSQSVPEFPVTFSAQSQEAEPVAGEADPLLQFDPVAKGHKREWVACNTCGRVANYDYVPYSMSHPILTLPCGHGAAERFDEATIKITEEEARKYFLAKRATQPPKAQIDEGLRSAIEKVRHEICSCTWNPDGHAANCPSGVLQNALFAAAPAKTQIPEGYALVPIEPTKEMIDSCRAKYLPSISLPVFVAAYKTMITAAPKPPTEGAQAECSGDPANCPENEGYGCCKPNPATEEPGP